MGVLGLESAAQASVDDDFFLAGGTSILASTLAAQVRSRAISGAPRRAQHPGGSIAGVPRAYLCAQIKKRFGMPMSGTALFKMRTIAVLAQVEILYGRDAAEMRPK